MLLLAHETTQDAIKSAKLLRALGERACSLLAVCVETTGTKRKKISRAAGALESASFIRIRSIGSIWGEQFHLLPTLAGEEALEALDDLLSNS